MTNKLEPLYFKRNSRKRLTTKIDQVFDDLQVLESVSPKEVTRRMTLTFTEMGTIREKIRKQNFNPENSRANHKYQQTKDKINKYVEQKYKNIPSKTSKNVFESPQVSPVTSRNDPSHKLLFDSIEQFGIKNSKRKFGKSLDLAPISNLPEKLPEIPKSKVKNTVVASPRSVKLSKLITKLMVKNLGIRIKENSEPLSPKIFCTTEGKSASESPKNGVELNFGDVSRRTRSNFKYGKMSFTMKNALNGFQSVDDEIFIDDEEIFAPEYIKYITDLDNSLTIQKYISQLSDKKRKAKQMLSKYSKV